MDRSLNEAAGTYPEGAIADVADLMRRFEAGEVTLYEASRKFKSVTEMTFTGKVGEQGDRDDGWVYHYFEYRRPGALKPLRMSLRDKHLLPQDYNDWFLFTDRALADAYVSAPRGMGCSLNEAARDIGQAMQQLRDAIRDKGYPEATAEVDIEGPEQFSIWLHTYERGAFRGGFSYAHCTASTLGEAYTKAVAAIAAMPDRAERAAS